MKIIRFASRWIWRAALLALVLAIAALLLKDILLKSWLESQIKLHASLDATIGRFELGIFSPTVTIENMVLRNKPEMGGGPLMKMPELRIEYDRQMASNGKLHLKLLRIHIEEFDLVTNEAGASNAEVLLGALGAALKGMKNMEFAGIDTLNLSIGKVVFINLKPPKTIQEQKIGLENEIITGIKTPEDLQQKILMKIMSSKLRKMLKL